MYGNQQYAHGQATHAPPVVIEPPSTTIFALMICASCCIFGWLPLIPLFVAYSARSDFLLYFTTRDFHRANDASGKSHKWLNITFATCAIMFLLFQSAIIYFLASKNTEDLAKFSTHDEEQLELWDKKTWQKALVAQIIIAVLVLLCLAGCAFSNRASKNKRVAAVVE
eukprot:GEMP01021713.1.p1 GENE.GEMP01021713.1~~GEMP01021713.1.p1  ORF type:complete len:168 (+),score=30.22 GEMP01021713.1:123-626(+)